MHDVQRAVGGAGDGDGSQRGLGLHRFWAAQLMALGACYPQGQHLLCSLKRQQEHTHVQGRLTNDKWRYRTVKEIHGPTFRSIRYRAVCVFGKNKFKPLIVCVNFSNAYFTIKLFTITP